MSWGQTKRALVDAAEDALITVAVAALIFFLAGCEPEKPACSPKALADIEEAYVVEAVGTCAGYTFDTCPELPAIRAKYDAMRDAWVSCH